MRWILTALTVPLLLAAVPAGTVAQDGSTLNLTLPTWRIGFSPYGSSYGMNLYRALGARTDLGLDLNVDLDSSTDDVNNYDQDYNGDHHTGSETREFDTIRASLGLDLRRWSPIGDKVAWNRGVRLTTAIYRRTNTSDQSRDGDNAQVYHGYWKDKSLRFTLGATVGFDLTLLDHLSVGLEMQPVSVYYETTTYETIAKRTDPTEHYSDFNTDKTDGDLYGVNAVSDTRGFLTISF